MPKQVKGTPTSLNLFTLREVFAQANEVPNRLSPSSYNGIKRCADAGFVATSKTSLSLTRAGMRAIVADLEATMKLVRAHRVPAPSEVEPLATWTARAEKMGATAEPVATPETLKALPYYQQRIVALLACSPREAAFTEAWMRLEVPTLDGLSSEHFKRHASESLACVRVTEDERNVELAGSFGIEARS